MWPHTLQLYLVVFASARLHSLTTPVAHGLETMAPPQCAGESQDKSQDVLVSTSATSITDCSGLEAMPQPMTEDVHLFVDSVEGIFCDSVRMSVGCLSGGLACAVERVESFFFCTNQATSVAKVTRTTHKRQANDELCRHVCFRFPHV